MNNLSIITFKDFTYESLVELASEVGFDGVHSGSWSADNVEELLSYREMTSAAGLAFDSALDFDLLARELAECGYGGDITLEVNYAKYADRLSKREYMQRAFDSASRLKALIEKYKGE